MSDPWEEHRNFREAHLQNKSTGARFRRVDFHFHTPASGKDYRDGAATYDQIAQRLSDERIDAVFVTDHNEWSGIKLLQQACKKLGGRTIVFPGVELTLTTKAICLLSEGKKINIVKFHCLALLPPDGDFEGKLKSLITNNHKYQDILNQKPVERVLRQTVEEVAELVRNDWGGIFIPAHLNQDKGIEKSRSIDDLYADSITIDLLKTTFDAVEIRKPESEKLFSGEFRTPEGLVVPEMCCVLGSDSHELATIGKEATYVLCEEISFPEIREATKHRSRMLLAPPYSKYAQLVSLNVDGAFLGRQAFSISPNMTAFIGSKGSGKTAVLELIRFALGYASPVEERYLSHLLGPNGRVSLEVKSASEDKFLFVRKAGDAVPTVYSHDGGLLERNSVIPSNINVEIRGWGETTKLATDVDEQLKLIANFDESDAIRVATQKIALEKAGLEATLTQLRSLVSKYKSVKADVQRLGMREATLKKLDTGKFTEKQSHKELRESELALLRGLQTEISTYRPTVQISLLSPQIDSMLESFEKKREGGGATAAAEAAEISAEVVKLRGAQAASNAAAQNSIAGFEMVLEECIGRIELRNAPLDDEYQSEFAKLSVDEQRVLTERNSVIQEISTLDASRARQAGLWRDISAELEKLSAALRAIDSAITSRSQRRDQISQQINQVLRDRNVGTKVEFSPRGRLAGNLPVGKGANDAYDSLAREFSAHTEQTITSDYRLSDVGSNSEFAFSIDDGIKVLFEIYPATWKESAELSAGQKSTAILPLLLMAARGPIILDQPEDNLDNKYIGSTVVRMINDRKQLNQMVITSHSASIVVMTDCELIVEMIDQGNQGKVSVAGFLAGPDSPIASSVLNILDGGRDALLTRFKKYGRLVS